MASQATPIQSSNLVLAGRRGVTVVPQPTPLTRLHYFDGKFLRASDLELEQRYLRSLVALSNQSGGAGVVHGFDCTLAGDRLEVGPGLAIDPEGRVLLLPEGRGVSLAELIEASRQSGALSLASAAKKAAGTSDFGTCEELAAGDGDGLAEGSSLYVITLCHAEALCGEEDVFGRLCAEACATSTERPYVLEGVLLRAVPVTLGTALAASKAVALTSRHLRSLVASAWFEDERRRGGSLISGAGLSSGAWCLGAESPGGACVPIALVARAGAATRFFDAWTARRERIEAPARRYWAGRMAMRPWDVFLAQILQFQCQLTECLGDTGGDPDDPCRQAWDLLREASRRLGRMIEGAAVDVREVEERETAERRRLALEYRQLDDLRGQLTDAAAALAAVPRERRLLACGITELPSAGYLPVVASSTVPVNDQVRAWMGEGVDLRFCAVRPDFVPHALEEAQHMERISLLAGLDDPAARPQVDILVPDGELLAAGLPAGAGYVVETALSYQFLALFARLLRDNGKPADDIGGVRAGQPDVEADEAEPRAGDAGNRRAALAVSLGRSLMTVAGAGRSGETPAGGAAFYHAAGSARVGGLDPAEPNSNRPRWAVESLRRVRRLDAERRGEVREALPQEGEIAADAQRVTGELWVRLETDRDLFTLARNGRTRVTGELAVAARFGDRASTLRGDLAGDLLVLRREERAGGVQVAAELRGTLDVAGDIGGGLAQSRRHALRESLVVTRSAGTGDGPATQVAIPRLGLLGTDLGVEVGLETEQRFTGPGRATFQLALTAAGTAKPNPDSPDDPQQSEIVLAAARAERDDRVAEPAHRAHEASVSALRNLSAVFHDPDYDDLRARLLFPGDAPDTAELRLRAVHDWVLFHRRRTKDCGDIPGRVQTVPRRYRVFYLPLPDVEQRDVVLRLLQTGGGLANYPMREIAEVTFGGGVAAIEEPPADRLQGRWQMVVPPGAQLGLGAIASREAAAAEGRALAENRLGALAGLLDDVTPLHPEAEVDVLPGVPADLDAGDADGVIVLAVIEAATTCQEVQVSTEAAWPSQVVQEFVRLIRDRGLFAVASRLQLERLGLARFAGANLEEGSQTQLAEKWRELQEQRPQLFRNAFPVALVISAPGTAAADLPGHRTQGEAIAAGLTPTAGNVIDAMLNGSQEFPVECPALTLILLQQIEIG